MESVWILTNLAYGTGDEIARILDDSMSIIPAIAQLITSPDPMVVEQVIWLLGNLIGDNAEARDLIISGTPIIRVMAALVEGQSIQKSLLKVICWVTSNITRGKCVGLDYEDLCKLYQIAKISLSIDTDDDLLSDALWSLSYLLNSDNDLIYGVVAEEYTV